MPLRTPFTEMFGLAHPLGVAPMGGVTGGALAATVSNAGGLGLVGGGYGDHDWLDRSTDTALRFGRGGPPQFPPPPSERSKPRTPDSPSRLHIQDLRRFPGFRRDHRGSALSDP
jgi:Nitronate monooxygenase